MIEVINAFLDGSTIAVITRDEDDKLTRRRFQAEFVAWLSKADAQKVESVLRRTPSIVSMRWENDWLRIGFRDWEARSAACDPNHYRTGGWLLKEFGCDPQEADLHPLKLWFAEEQIKFLRPRRVYLDIEVDTRKPIKLHIDGEARVLLWSLCSDGDVIQEVLEADTDEAERTLLKAFWEEIQGYDQVVAWNGDYYDFLVMWNRSNRLGLQIDPRRWIWLDHLPVFRRMNMSSSESGDEKQSMALHAVAMAVLGFGKDDFDVMKTYEVWATGKGKLFEDLCKYNMKDAALMAAIEKKTGYLELHQAVCETCNVLSDTRGANPSTFVEGYMLKMGRERGIRFPSKWQFEAAEQFAGAYVMEPTKKGIVRDVHVFDFSAMYPSIIISWNMSPETYAGKGGDLQEGCCMVPMLQHQFRTDVEGVLPAVLKSLMGHRKHWNDVKETLPPGTEEWKDADRRSTALKIVVNSVYGVQGAQSSRFYKREVAESTTQTGVWLVKQTIAAAEERGFEPFYGDTDSGFVTNCSERAFREFVQWCNDSYYKQLVEPLKIRDYRIKVAYEKSFSLLVMVGKKRYAGRFAHYKGKQAQADSKPEIKGLEFKRGDTSKLARALQLKIIQLLLTGEYGAKYFHELIELEQQHIMSSQLRLEDIKISKTLKRDPRFYAAPMRADNTPGLKPQHVRVAEDLISQGVTVQEGSRIGYVIVDAGGDEMELVAESQFTGEYDRHYLWEHLVYPPSMRILEACFPEIIWRNFLRTRPSAKSRVSKNQLSFFK